MNISEVLKKEHILLDFMAETKEDVLKGLTDLLAESGAVSDKYAFLTDVIARENASATGIGNGIAIPHGKSSSVSETTVAIARLEHGIEWESVDDEPIKFVVLLAVKESDKTGVHVKLLSEMARKLASAENCRRLLNAKDKDEIVSIFSE